MRAAIITVSDTRTLGDDISGDKLVELVLGFSGDMVERAIVTDDSQRIADKLIAMCEGEVDVIFTTGGTGFSPRDNTPEATRTVIEREAPGLAEAMRRETAAKHPMAMLSRGVCGIRGKTLIINLPGSPRGVEECFAVIKDVLPHAVELIRGNTEH
ncbi:MAG TPA: MogA/MoaB family molybdenum cofactor biosynthesis protein [Pyrinomonadaceae bacterium]|nr:MogA/MoaB family molybdenum cofactor biosynthesis protein [Pyrinomonadaceae bacterium]